VGYARHVSTRIVALLLSLAALVFTPRAFATSCEVPQLKSSSERAEVIFLGVAAAETPVGGGVSNFRLRVERVFKGSLPATVTVSGGGMKGSSFTVGDRYLVFARVPEPSAPRPPDLFAHLCGGTQTAARAADWLATLGVGTAPTNAGTAIVAGAPADIPPVPPTASVEPAPSSDAPTAEPRPRTEPTVLVPPADTSQANTTPASTLATSGGCAGCTSAAASPIAPSASLTFVALLLLLRRRSDQS